VRWHAETVEAVLDDLDVDESGLSTAEASRRREEAGPNELAEDEGRGPVAILVEQFRSALIGVLFAAALLAAFVGDVVDAALIVAILVANAGFGFAQNYRAEQSLQSLRELAAPTADVRRAGEWTTVDVRELVPGDVVRLTGGDTVPADCRLVETTALQVDESALTGESVPVEKRTDPVEPDTPLAERVDAVYRGTNVTRGRGLAVVVATGMDTEMGAIAASIGTAADRQTPLQRDLDALGRRVGVGVVALAVVIVGVLVLNGTSPVQAGLAAISLAVAAIPEGLPAVVTLTLALGVRAMADEDALVRRLSAVEALGSVDVICTDKTGTLTEGRMRVQRVWVHDRVFDVDALDGDAERAAFDDRLDRLFDIGALCNDATGEDGDPSEQALVTAAREYGIDVDRRRTETPRTDEIPFSAERRLMTTAHDDLVYVKGAPAEVLDRSSSVLTADGPETLNESTRRAVEEQTAAFAGDALRVFGFAYRERDDDGLDETDFVFVGLQGMFDPPREGVEGAVADTLRAGIDVKMLTGDNERTARAIAEQVGLEPTVTTGTDLEGMDAETLQRHVHETTVFARVTPAHKVRVLEVLQAADHTVAMTGDGVNDGPALSRADVGVAMGIRGTDVAKQSSDLVLLDDDYATIRTAVRRGRTIFDNVWKFVAYLLSANLAEVLLVFVASLFGYLILPAVQLLWINLLTDGLPALALGTDPEAEDVMDRPPRRSGVGVIDRRMAWFIGGAGVTATVVMLALTAYTLDGAPAATPYAVTMVFTGFVLLEFEKLYVVRWLGETPLFSNWRLALAVALSLALQLSVLYTPLAGLFGTVPLALGDWAVLVVAVVVALPPLVGVAAAIRRWVSD